MLSAPHITSLALSATVAQLASTATITVKSTALITFVPFSPVLQRLSPLLSLLLHRLPSLTLPFLIFVPLAVAIHPTAILMLRLVSEYALYPSSNASSSPTTSTTLSSLTWTPSKPKWLWPRRSTLPPSRWQETATSQWLSNRVDKTSSLKRPLWYVIFFHRW